MFSSLQMRNTIGLSDLDLSLSIFQTTFFSQFFRERLVLSDVNTFLILDADVTTQFLVGTLVFRPGLLLHFVFRKNINLSKINNYLCRINNNLRRINKADLDWLEMHTKHSREDLVGNRNK